MGDVCTIIEKSLDFEPNKDNIFNLSSGATFSMIDLAEKVQMVHYQRYGKEVKIYINENDKTMVFNLFVDNLKLNKKVNIEFNDKLHEEIVAIFDLLEKV